MLANNPEFSRERILQPLVKPVERVLAEIAESHGLVAVKHGGIIYFNRPTTGQVPAISQRVPK